MSDPLTDIFCMMSTRGRALIFAEVCEICAIFARKGCTIVFLPDVYMRVANAVRQLREQGNELCGVMSNILARVQIV